jgi:hypothetical protein
MSGERVVVVKKQKLPLTFGKRGAEAARSSLAELNQSQPVPNRTAEHWRSSCTAVVRYVLMFEPFRSLETPGGAAYEKGFANPLSICMHTFLLMNLSMSLGLE